MSTIPYTLSETAVTVFIDGNTYPVDQSNPQYNVVIEALKNNDVDTIRKAINVKQTLVEQSTGRISIEDGTLYCDGEPINHALVTRIMAMFEDGFDVSPLMNFLDNLLNNPSFRAVKELYGFLEACNLPITSDGCFLAYKIVGNDYMDCYTGTFDNSVGKVCSMPRNEVDEDSNQTCSNGLHVCSQDYLPHYGSFRSGGDKCMVVKVNPENVVAVPRDYNNSKMRVCEYIVVDELEDYTNRIKEDFTSEYNDETDSCDDVETVESDTSEFVSEDQTDMFDDDDFNDDVDTFFDDDDEEDDFDDVQIPKGEVNSNVLSYQNVWDIHSLLEDGMPLATLGTQFNISARQVGRIRDGIAHGHVKTDYENFVKNR